MKSKLNKRVLLPALGFFILILLGIAIASSRYNAGEIFFFRQTQGLCRNCGGIQVGTSYRVLLIKNSTQRTDDTPIRSLLFTNVPPCDQHKAIFPFSFWHLTIGLYGFENSNAKTIPDIHSHPSVLAAFAEINKTNHHVAFIRWKQLLTYLPLMYEDKSGLGALLKGSDPALLQQNLVTNTLLDRVPLYALEEEW